VRQSLVSQGFDGVPVGREVGQKPLNQRTKTIKPRTKTIKPLPPYPSQVLERQGFQEGIFPIFL